MAIQYEVEQSMNQLIQNMVNLVDKDTKIANSSMEKHQIKNLLEVALETTSVEVVKHFILFQVGRDGPGTSWRHNDFGKKLVERIDNLRATEGRLILDKVSPLSPNEAGQAQTALTNLLDEIWMLLTRAYLGQFNRYFYYRKEETRWPRVT
ncbi:MAG: hypothetical protein H3C36_15580, partial [Chitinophagaceae bacterium]|nr:hypothetical protein [Chitinophagaceae bacterium]